MKLNKDTKEKVGKLYKIIEKCEENHIYEREESLNLLKESILLYNEIIKSKGTCYCSRKLPDVPERMNQIIYDILEYPT